MQQPTTNGNRRSLPGVRTYRGPKLEDLIPRIRAELGPDAIILRQREGLMGGFGGFFAQRCVEVDAQAAERVDFYDDEPEDLPPSAREPAPAFADAEPFVKQPSVTPTPVAADAMAADEAPPMASPEDASRFLANLKQATARAEQDPPAKLEAGQAPVERAGYPAEDETRLDAEGEAWLDAEDEARLDAEEEARLDAEDEAQRVLAEEQARLVAKEEAQRVVAEEQARLDAEQESQRVAAEQESQRVAAEEEAQRVAAEERTRLVAEEQARVAAAHEAQRVAAEEQARLVAEEQARRVAAEQEAQRVAAEEQARLMAEEAARRVAAEREAQRVAAEEEAERLAAEEQARLVAEQEARRVAAEQEAQRVTAEEEARRVTAEQEARRVAAEQEAQRVAAEEEARSVAAELEAQRVAAEDEARHMAALARADHVEAAELMGELTGHGISYERAQALILSVLTHRRPFAGLGEVRDGVRTALAAHLPAVASLPAGGAAIAIIGAGGAGKTRCVAALATAYARAGDLRVTVIAPDTEDAGVELARLLRGENVQVLANTRPHHTAHVIKDAREKGLVIVDTVAVTPGDQCGIAELEATLKPLALDARYLTLPATLSAPAGARLIEGFARMAPTGIAVTHIDEADQLGVAIELALTSGVPVAYMHEGLDLGAAITPAYPSTLAQRLLP
jgi:flagellar biosynthesis GTPase FlhF